MNRVNLSTFDLPNVKQAGMKGHFSRILRCLGFLDNLMVDVHGKSE